jgi:hypothetical protein
MTCDLKKESNIATPAPNPSPQVGGEYHWKAAIIERRYHNHADTAFQFVTPLAETPWRSVIVAV